MKLLALLLAAFAFTVSAVASAQDNPPATDQTAPVAQATADPAPAGASPRKICRMMKNYRCKVDQSLAPGAHCMCGDHPGTVYSE